MFNRYLIIGMSIGHYSGLNAVIRGAETVVILIIFLASLSAKSSFTLPSIVRRNFIVIVSCFIAIVVFIVLISALDGAGVSGWFVNDVAKILTSALYFLAFFLLVKNDSDYEYFLKSTLYVSLVSSILMGCFQYINGYSLLHTQLYETTLEIAKGESRFSTLINPDPNLAWLELMFGFVLCALLYYRGKAVFGMVSLLYVISMFLTGSRAGLISLVFFIALFVFLNFRPAVRRGLFLIGVSLMFVFCMGLLVWGVDLIYQIEFGNVGVERTVSIYNLYLRMEIWEVLLESLNGYGFFGGMASDPRDVVLSNIGIFVNPHSNYIGLLYNYGVFGVIGYAVIIVYMFVKLSSSLLNKYEKDRQTAVLVSSIASYSIFVSTIYIGIDYFFTMLCSIAMYVLLHDFTKKASDGVQIKA